MERPDCPLHRLDTRLFPGFAGELQKYLGVKQYMPPSYLRASALLGRPIILSFWDHVSKAEVVNIREARLLRSMLSEDGAGGQSLRPRRRHTSGPGALQSSLPTALRAHLPRLRDDDEHTAAPRRKR